LIIKKFTMLNKLMKLELLLASIQKLRRCK
jgi:hypothetical protein